MAAWFTSASGFDAVVVGRGGVTTSRSAIAVRDGHRIGPEPPHPARFLTAVTIASGVMPKFMYRSSKLPDAP